MHSNRFCQTLYFVRHRVAQERYLNSWALSSLACLSAQTSQELGLQACAQKGPGTRSVQVLHILVQTPYKEKWTWKTLFLGRFSGHYLLSLDGSRTSSVTNICKRREIQQNIQLFILHGNPIFNKSKCREIWQNSQ